VRLRWLAFSGRPISAGLARRLAVRQQPRSWLPAGWLLPGGRRPSRSLRRASRRRLSPEARAVVQDHEQGLHAASRSRRMVPRAPRAKAGRRMLHASSAMMSWCYRMLTLAVTIRFVRVGPRWFPYPRSRPSNLKPRDYDSSRQVPCRWQIAREQRLSRDGKASMSARYQLLEEPDISKLPWGTAIALCWASLKAT
jgi:hypothetical protein